MCLAIRIRHKPISRILELQDPTLRQAGLANFDHTDHGFDQLLRDLTPTIQEWRNTSISVADWVAFKRLTQDLSFAVKFQNLARRTRCRQAPNMQSTRLVQNSRCGPTDLGHEPLACPASHGGNHEVRANNHSCTHTSFVRQ